MAIRNSFQQPKPGRIYTRHKRNRSGELVRYLVVEIRTAPGVLERTGFSLEAHSRRDAERMARAWLAPREIDQRRNYAAARRAWDEARAC